MEAAVRTGRIQEPVPRSPALRFEVAAWCHDANSKGRVSLPEHSCVVFGVCHDHIPFGEDRPLRRVRPRDSKDGGDIGGRIRLNADQHIHLADHMFVWDVMNARLGTYRSSASKGDVMSAGGQGLTEAETQAFRTSQHPVLRAVDKGSPE